MTIFDVKDLKGLSAGSLLSKELQVHLPKFKHFQHSFQELLTATTKKKYDLKWLVAKVKNDSILYDNPSVLLSTTKNGPLHRIASS